MAGQSSVGRLGSTLTMTARHIRVLGIAILATAAALGILAGAMVLMAVALAATLLAQLRWPRRAAYCATAWDSPLPQVMPSSLMPSGSRKWTA